MDSAHAVRDKVANVKLALEDSEGVLVFVSPHADVGAGRTAEEREVEPLLFANCPHLPERFYGALLRRRLFKRTADESARSFIPVAPYTIIGR